jgi:hypothetical protein
LALLGALFCLFRLEQIAQRGPPVETDKKHSPEQPLLRLQIRYYFPNLTKQRKKMMILFNFVSALRDEKRDLRNDEFSMKDLPSVRFFLRRTRETFAPRAGAAGMLRIIMWVILCDRWRL